MSVGRLIQTSRIARHVTAKKVSGMRQKENSCRETNRKRRSAPEHSAGTSGSAGRVPEDFFDESRLHDAGMNRRDWMKLVGAQLLMVSMAGCIKKPEKIIPYVKSVEEIVPGNPLVYATLPVPR